MLLESRPTINIEGLVAGYTGPGGKTVLPHKAVAKIDMRLVPDMTAADTLAKLKAHSGQTRLQRHRSQHERRLQPDADRSRTANSSRPSWRPIASSDSIRSYGRARRGSWPGYVFTDAPLSLAAGHFGLGHGTGAHAPDEYYLIESTNPKIQGLDGAVASFVEYLCARLGATALRRLPAAQRTRPEAARGRPINIETAHPAGEMMSAP